MQPLSPRFTLQCMKELGIELPSLEDQVLLYEYEPAHRLIEEAKRIYQVNDESYFDRIKSVDDNVFLKCKTNDRFRGAIWVDKTTDDNIWWIVAGGYRTEGSKTDFYKELELKCNSRLREQRKLDPSFKSGKSSHSDWLLPDNPDYAIFKSAKAYLALLSVRKELIQTFIRACHNKNLSINYKIRETVINICYVDDTEIYFTFGSNNYDGELQQDIYFVLSTLGFDDESCEERNPPIQKSHKNVRLFFCMKSK